MDPSGLQLTNLAVFELELATRLSPGGAKSLRRLRLLRLATVLDYRGLPARKVAVPLIVSLDVASNL